MIGTLFNVAGILIGGGIGLARRRPLSIANEALFKVALAAFTTFYGLRLAWVSLGDPFSHKLKQLLIVIVALMLGKVTGGFLGLQNMSNRLGQRAKERIASAKPGKPGQAGEGFQTCAALFCAAPLGIVGAISEGLTSPPYYYPLAVKGVMDGLAALGFVSLFGWGVLLAAVPVLTVQGTITVLCWRFLQPFLVLHGLEGPINATAGLLVFSVALVMLGLKKIELTNYLPSLIFAPLIASIFRV